MCPSVSDSRPSSRTNRHKWEEVRAGMRACVRVHVRGRPVGAQIEKQIRIVSSGEAAGEGGFSGRQEVGGTETKREYPERGDGRDTTVTRALSVIMGSEEGSALALESRDGNDQSGERLKEGCDRWRGQEIQSKWTKVTL